MKAFILGCSRRAMTSRRFPVPSGLRASRKTQPPTAVSAEQIERLNNLTPAAGERHNEASMAVIDR
jgi:hypothetical protein